MIRMQMGTFSKDMLNAVVFGKFELFSTMLKMQLNRFSSVSKEQANIALTLVKGLVNGKWFNIQHHLLQIALFLGGKLSRKRHVTKANTVKLCESSDSVKDLA